MYSEGFNDLENTILQTNFYFIEPYSSDEPTILEETTLMKCLIRIPSTFYGYKIIKFIGKGSFSVVALVQMMHSGKQFAAKILSIEEMEKMNLSNSIRQEIQILRSLNHPNILKYYDSFAIKMEDGKENFVIITEFCERGSLAKFIENDGINSQNIKPILKGIVRALYYIHLRGISHCDIKPDNILLDSDFNTILSDFGFATYSELTTNTCCTLNYASPELVALKGPFSPMISDIWSLGVTLYLTATHSFPYNYKKVISEQCIQEALSNIHNPNLRNMISGCLQINPYKRASIKQILNSEYFMEE